MKTLSCSLALLLLLCFACGESSPKQVAELDQIAQIDTVKINGDTIFDQKGYFIELLVLFREKRYYNEKMNAVLNFGLVEGNDTTILTSDSLYTCMEHIEFKDMDADGVKDMLIWNRTSANSNLRYHLYLIDAINGTLKKVEGFNEVWNPRLIENTAIIESFVLSGSSYVQFYTLNPDKELCKFDYFIDNARTDSAFVAYQSAIAQIKAKLAKGIYGDCDFQYGENPSEANIIR